MTTTNLGMTKPTVGADSDTWGGELNADLDLIDAFAGKLMPGAEVTVASAAICDIGGAASTAVAISGTTTITSFGTVANCIRFVRFTGALTLTHNATSLILLGGANQMTAAGDCAIFQSDGSGNWRQRTYFSAAYIPSAHTGTGSFAHAVSPQLAAPFLGVATGTSLALNGATLGSNALAAIGNINLAGDYLGANFYAQPAGYGAFTSKGFGIDTILQGPSITTTYGGGFQITAVSAGVLLPGGGTSWTAVSERSKKRDLQPLPGDPLEIIGAHDVQIGRYIEDADDGPLRPFLFYEDAIASFPFAATNIPEHTIKCPKSGEEKVVPEYKGLSLELYVPLLVAAFKRQVEINARLEDRISALEAG